MDEFDEGEGIGQTPVTVSFVSLCVLVWLTIEMIDIDKLTRIA